MVGRRRLGDERSTITDTTQPLQQGRCDMARTPKVTWDMVRALIRAGYGVGHGIHYKPLLAIKRWNPSPVSVQVRRALPPYGRTGHFFSLSEWSLATVFVWAGAIVREQLAMWPWCHPHPQYGLNADIDSTWPWSEGMEAVCSAAGIRHGTFPGTSIPYIWTIDLALTIPWAARDIPGCTFVSVKPLDSERYIYIDPLDRGPEKLEGERQYARALGIKYFVGDRGLYSGDLLGQLDFLISAARLPRSHRWWPTLQRFLDRHEPYLSSSPISEWVERLQADFGAAKNEADYLVHHCIWHQIVDVDISRYLDFSKCPIGGGRRLRDELRRSLWEDPQ